MNIHSTRYPELGYARYAPNLWRIIDLTDKTTMAVVGPHYKSKAELLADLDRYARVFGAEAAAVLPYAVDDYRNAPNGEGPLAAQWRDKPHRLIYDLCNALEQLL
jgi:hypothetical protein